MFKIIKTSTYNNFVNMQYAYRQKQIKDDKKYLEYTTQKEEEIRLLKDKLHTLTAEKLPIKKSKSK